MACIHGTACHHDKTSQSGHGALLDRNRNQLQRRGKNRCRKVQAGMASDIHSKQKETQGQPKAHVWQVKSKFIELLLEKTKIKRF